MAKYTVYGQALAPVGVTFHVDADNELAAEAEVLRRWGKGDRGAMKYLDDEAAALDFAVDRVYPFEGI